MALEVVHEEFTGLEALATVRGSYCHENDLIERLEWADTVDHACSVDVEAFVRLVDHRFDEFLCHAGIVL